MVKKLRGFLLACAIVCFYTTGALAQSDNSSFKNNQFASGRVADAYKKYNDTISREFRKKGINYPPKDIYLRTFKSQNEMELWARNNETSEYKLVKTYRICALSGMLGPKRTQGDRQVPEGYYFIEEFNPKSETTSPNDKNDQKSPDQRR